MNLLGNSSAAGASADAGSAVDIVERSKDILLEIGASPILYLMLVLSVMSVAVMLERAWFFLRNSEDAGRLGRLLENRLASGGIEAAERAMRASRAIEAGVVAAGLAHAGRGVQGASRAMQGAMAMARLRLERRLSFLGTLGNNAPFVGLLGTVIGIVQAFHELERAGLSGSGGSGIMGAIAEALVATAIGLAVAIPAVAAFNYFHRRIRTILASAEALEQIVLAHVEGASPAAAAAASAPDSEKPLRLSLAALPVTGAPSIRR